MYARRQGKGIGSSPLSLSYYLFSHYYWCFISSLLLCLFFRGSVADRYADGSTYESTES